jgi:hypothetical protein
VVELYCKVTIGYNPKWPLALHHCDQRYESGGHHGACGTFSASPRVGRSAPPLSLVGRGASSPRPARRASPRTGAPAAAQDRASDCRPPSCRGLLPSSSARRAARAVCIYTAVRMYALPCRATISGGARRPAQQQAMRGAAPCAPGATRRGLAPPPRHLPPAPCDPPRVVAPRS